MPPYQLMYRLALARGRALDVGCGTGRDAVHRAQRGWDVTRVDAAGVALAKAGARAAEVGVDVRFVEGDVAHMPALGLEAGCTLLYDLGCIHGLPDPALARAA